MNRNRRILVFALIFAIFSINVSVLSLRSPSFTAVTRYGPMEAISLLLSGGLRGIAVDFLWVKALARHEEKKYYELLTINNLISKLQPDFPAVWIFQAWNMAYNIAHEWDAPQNKWKWIHSGLDFAKKGAIKNPQNGDLFFELGYMYLHIFDRRYFKYAPYYRKQLKVKEGIDNYDASLYWFRKALVHTPKLRDIEVVERTICHTLWRAALCAEEEGHFDKALSYVNTALNKWRMYQVKYLEDDFVNINMFIRKLEEKKKELHHLLNTKSALSGQEW